MKTKLNMFVFPAVLWLFIYINVAKSCSVGCSEGLHVCWCHIEGFNEGTSCKGMSHWCSKDKSCPPEEKPGKPCDKEYKKPSKYIGLGIKHIYFDGLFLNKIAS